MQELFLSLVSQFFNRHRNLSNLSDALEEYRNDKQSSAAQLRLEATFFKAFKKKASAKFIDRLAQSEWGPLEALTVFGRTSVAVSCDFSTHNMKLSRWFNYGSSRRAVIAFLLGLPAVVLGIASFLVGLFIMYVVFLEVYLTGGDEVLKEGIETAVKIFSVGSIGIAVTVFGGFFTYMGWDLVAALESENKAVELYKELNPDS